MCRSIFALFLLILTAKVYTQTNQLPQSVFVKMTEEKITLDGVLDDAVWSKSKNTGRFVQYAPENGQASKYPTELKFLYDAENLYVGVNCTSLHGSFLSSTLRRDYEASGSDNITLIFDTFKDQNNAFFFGINAAGVRREGLISGGGEELKDFSLNWDNKWAGKTHVTGSTWTAELVIPLKTLRFKKGDTSWRFSAYRFDSQTNERSSWVQVPRNEWIFNLNFMGRLLFEHPLPASGNNISLIPFVRGGISKRTFGREKYDGRIGLDAKISINSGLNLDVTFNPDFSQAEVDRQITDLSRFEILYPEQRQFFLENADLFGSFGSSRINPFFSRRIGVLRDENTGTYRENPIYIGARLSGKLNNKTRVGLLSIQTAANEVLDIPSYNHTVTALQYKIGNSSNLGFIFVNKQTSTIDTSLSPNNRVAGIEYNIGSPNNRWNGKVFYQQMFSNANSFFENSAHGTEITFKKRRYSLEWLHQWVGMHYRPGNGFVPRVNYFRINPELKLYFYPQNKLLEQHALGLEFSEIWSPGVGKTDHELDLFWDYSLNSGASGRLSFKQNYVFLTAPFDPSNSNKRELPAMTEYEFSFVSARFQSDQRNLFYYSLEPTIGQYYNGIKYEWSGEVGMRLLQYGNIGFNFTQANINLPEPYTNTSLWLLGPRLNITFTKGLFLSTYLQYNNQIKNININSRLQWRFAPVSDLYLIYAENYFPNRWESKGKSFILKATYWLNL